MEFDNEIVKKILVTLLVPGVFCFKNDKEKTVWISYSNCISESLVRNLKLIKSGEHVITISQDYSVVILSQEPEEGIKFSFVKHCLNYKSLGYRLLNKELSYSVKGFILSDYRDASNFLYYVFLMAGKRKFQLLGIFDRVSAGEEFIRRLNQNQDYFIEPPVEFNYLLDGFGNFAQTEYNKLMGQK